LLPFRFAVYARSGDVPFLLTAATISPVTHPPPPRCLYVCCSFWLRLRLICWFDFPVCTQHYGVYYLRSTFDLPVYHVATTVYAHANAGYRGCLADTTVCCSLRWFCDAAFWRFSPRAKLVDSRRRRLFSRDLRLRGWTLRSFPVRLLRLPFRVPVTVADALRTATFTRSFVRCLVAISYNHAFVTLC